MILYNKIGNTIEQKRMHRKFAELCFNTTEQLPPSATGDNETASPQCIDDCVTISHFLGNLYMVRQ